MNKVDMLRKLNNVVEKAALSAIRKCIPLRVSEKSILVGNLVVNKNSNNCYDVLNSDKVVLFKDIISADIAVIIAQKYNNKHFSTIDKILDLEKNYAKYHLDMLHYLNCMRISKKKKNYERLSILEDKFKIAENRAKRYKNGIVIFKSAF